MNVQINDVDARGVMCPEPLHRAELAMRKLAPGDVLRIVATDPAAPLDLEAWCLRRQHEFISCEAQGDCSVIIISKGNNPEPSR